MRRGYLVFDIETVPDENLYPPPEVPVGAEKPFPPLHVHRPVAIGALWLAPDLRFIRLGVVGEERNKDERDQLAAFSGFVRRQAPTLVTWNGRGFDLPVIVLRSLHHGIPLGWYYERSDMRHRYSYAGHLDLCDVLAEHGAGRHLRLDSVARLIGLPGKMGVDGSQVEGLYTAGKLDEIRRYCLLDVAQTGFTLMRFLHLAGQRPLGAVRAAMQELLDALERDGRFEEFLGRIDRDRLLLPGRGDPPADPPPPEPGLDSPEDMS